MAGMEPAHSCAKANDGLTLLADCMEEASSGLTTLTMLSLVAGVLVLALAGFGIWMWLQRRGGEGGGDGQG